MSTIGVASGATWVARETAGLVVRVEGEECDSCRDSGDHLRHQVHPLRRTTRDAANGNTPHNKHKGPGSLRPEEWTCAVKSVSWSHPGNRVETLR